MEETIYRDLKNVCNSFDSIGIRGLVGTIEEMASEIARMHAVPTYYKETLSRVDAYHRRYNRQMNLGR